MPETPVARRRAPRVPVSLDGTLRARRARPATVVDLSLTGALVRCEARLEPGSIHDLELRLGASPFSVKARVTEASVDGAAPPGDARRFLVGLEFLRLPAQDEAALRGFLRQEARRPAR